SLRKNRSDIKNEYFSLTTSNNHPVPFHPCSHKNSKKEKLKNNLLFFSLINILWLLLRTGTKPSRIVYPCQQTALSNVSMSLSILFPLSINALSSEITTFLSKNKKLILALSVIGVIGFGLVVRPLDSYQECQLILEPRNATGYPVSDIYVVNGETAAHVAELVDLMGSEGLLFYKSNVEGTNSGSEGLIARDDVVLLKINAQWPYRGGTNTDILKELIQVIVDHPDSFVGEIVVVDNGQGRGSMDWTSNNAEDHGQSTQDVVDIYSSNYNVSTYLLDSIRGTRVDEYSEGDMTSGYILYDTADPETGIQVSYPKFETDYGTPISFKYGIWNGTGYEKRLKVINMPVLKSHSIYGVTAALKNYMGVQSEKDVFCGGIANGHATVGTGGMGTLMVETGLPVLNIIDAIWVNANPKSGPSTSYSAATRVNVLVAGTDPVALDYWAAKHVLVQAANLTGHSDTRTLDPDNTEKSGLAEAFGVWLDLTKNEITRGDYSVTSNENNLNVHVYQNGSTTLTISKKSSTALVQGFGLTCVVLSLATCIPLILRKQRK
ncbi:MAG: DUF362 domain-containing protein, partial [Candidatus Odinarchaeota archaeon]